MVLGLPTGDFPWCRCFLKQFRQEKSQIILSFMERKGRKGRKERFEVVLGIIMRGCLSLVMDHASCVWGGGGRFTAVGCSIIMCPLSRERRIERWRDDSRQLEQQPTPIGSVST